MLFCFNLPNNLFDSLYLSWNEVTFISKVTLLFDDDGQVSFGINHEEEDYLFDDISAGLISKKILSDKKDLFEQIEVYNKAIKLLREQNNNDK